MEQMMRANLEIGHGGNYHLVDEALLKRLETDTAFASKAIEPVKIRLKEAFGGLGHIFGRDLLLSLCREVIAEDFAPDGPQTPSGEEADEIQEHNAWNPVYEEAILAGNAAGLAKYNEAGRRDLGSCGHFYFILKRGASFTKWAEAQGLVTVVDSTERDGLLLDVGNMRDGDDEISVQASEVNWARGEAINAVLKKYGTQAKLVTWTD